MKISEVLLEKLNKLGVSYELIALPENLSDDVSEHMAFHGGDMSQANVNLVYKTNQGYVIVQKRGDTKINNKKLRQALGTNSIRFASSEEMDNLGLVPGMVPITGTDLPIYTDSKILEIAEMYSTAADGLHGVKFSTQDLMKINPDMHLVEITDVSERRTISSVVSGITPSGNMLHIGNYFGAVKPHIDLQDTIERAYYFVADLHALTTVKDRAVLEDNIYNVILDYLALGLDPEKVVFFRQSDVPAHSQLAVVLGNYVSYGQMQRMHAFKDKLQKNSDLGAINMGLFNYPILMAADILLYKPDGVPVGEDQRQHVELTRDIGENFNKAYSKEFFPLPDPLIPESKRAKVIGTDGERKMSKSIGNVIGIFEDEAQIAKQIMNCYTDPTRIKATDPGKVEGNPVFIYHDLLNDNLDEVQDLKDRYRQGTVGDVEVKQKLIAAHNRYFAQARARRIELEKDLDYVGDILEQGAQKARVYAQKTMEEIYEMIGERPFGIKIKN